MKARIPTENKISKKQRDEIKQYVFDEVQKYLQKEYEDCTRRLFKLMAVELNKKYGFGKKRLTDLFDACGERAIKERQKDEIFWEHVDRVVIDQIGLDFLKEDYNEMDR